jgi:Protein of unknown function (DUF3147)
VPIRITFDPAGLRETKWREVALRFLFGGIVTVGTGLIAKGFGPAVGGLFMAFPAIFPASATLVAKHEEEGLEHAGFKGESRAAGAAALDARGTAMGTFGLMVFGLVTWKFLPADHTPWVLLGGTLVWFGVAVTFWWLRKAIRRQLWARRQGRRTA